MKLDMVLFDMDGTFINSRPYHAKVFYELFKQNYREIPYEKCFEQVGFTVRQIFDNCGVPEEMQTELFEKLDLFYVNEGKSFISMTSVPDGFRELLDYLGSKGIKRTVVTNSLSVVVKSFMDHHKLWDKFEHIQGADRDSVDKISRCTAMLNRFNIKPENVMVVGDTEGDIRLGNTMGFLSCFAKTDIAWYKDAEYIAKELRPTITIGTFAELQEFFKQMQN